MEQLVVLDISTAWAVAQNDISNVFPLKLIIYSCACPATQQFEIQPQEALMCFEVNNFPRSSLTGDMFVCVPLRQRQGITQRYKNTVWNYVHPFSSGNVKPF
jgi:hypothetical protein